MSEAHESSTSQRGSRAVTAQKCNTVQSGPPMSDTALERVVNLKVPA